MSPVSRQASVTATLLRYLGTAARFRSIYPADHTLVQRGRGDLLQVIDLLLRDRESVTFQIYEDTFFLENQMLPEETLRNGALLKACQDRSIGVFTIQRGVSDVEIDAFVSLLIQSVQKIQAGGGAAAYLGSQNVQHITVAPPRSSPAGGLEEVEVEPVSAYEAGHVVAQDLQARAVRRLPLDMKKARIFLSAAMEVVLENRFSLLGLMSNREYGEGSSYHAVNVSILALLIGTNLGLEHDQLLGLGMSGLVHDIGKVRLPYLLLNRVELTTEEREQHDRHPVHGANILRELDGSGRVAAMVALEHHVHFDGSGYPVLPAKSKPHLFSRIVSVVDAYDTLTSARRGTEQPLRPELAMKYIGAGLGTIFDPVIGKVFLKMMGLYPVGSLVELGKGELAVVIRPSDQHVDRPVVQIVKDGRLAELVDLATDTEQWITTVVDPADANIDVSALLSQPVA
jgi:HD-GYP domain-containing protein (c-di-GMP phosphodiesterase class II)